MKNKFLYCFFVVIGVFCFYSYGAENKTNENHVALTNTVNKTVESPVANNNVPNDVIEQESPRRKRSKQVATYLKREEWQSGVGYKEMQRYVKRLAHLCEDRMPGLVNGIAAGKRGILLNVSFKGQKSFYMARENTEEFLSAIIGDLEKMPEQVALSVYVMHNRVNIISAIKTNGKVKVKFLL